MAQTLENRGQYGEYLNLQTKTGLSWRLFLFAIFALAISVLSYLGLEFGYKSFLMSENAKAEEKIRQSFTEIEETEQKNLIAFNSQIINLKNVLGAHIFGSSLFPFLEQSTGESVVYNSMALSVADREILLDGFTDSYATLAGQAQFFEGSKSVEKVVIGSSSFSQGSVKFNLRITLKKDFFDVKQSAHK